MCSSINVSRFSQWSVKKLHKNCLFYICMDGESQNFIRRTWIWIKTNQWKMTQLLSRTNLGNCWNMVQKLEISFKAVKGWFPDFHSFYLFYSKYMKINIQRFCSKKIFNILSLIIGFVRFHELFMVICGYICATRILWH